MFILEIVSLIASTVIYLILLIKSIFAMKLSTIVNEKLKIHFANLIFHVSYFLRYKYSG